VRIVADGTARVVSVGVDVAGHGLLAARPVPADLRVPASA
jgi:hypothetical protein